MCMLCFGSWSQKTYVTDEFAQAGTRHRCRFGRIRAQDWRILRIWHKVSLHVRSIRAFCNLRTTQVPMVCFEAYIMHRQQEAQLLLGYPTVGLADVQVQVIRSSPISSSSWSSSYIVRFSRQAQVQVILIGWCRLTRMLKFGVPVAKRSCCHPVKTDWWYLKSF